MRVRRREGPEPPPAAVADYVYAPLKAIYKAGVPREVCTSVCMPIGDFVRKCRGKFDLDVDLVLEHVQLSTRRSFFDSLPPPPLNPRLNNMKVLPFRHLSTIMSTVSALSSSSSAAPPSSNTVVPATYSNLNDNALQKPLLDATCPEPVGASILYEDDFVKLTKSSLRIKWYYFPIGASKVIPLKSIQKVSDGAGEGYTWEREEY
jgi:hypothetical protein